MRIIQEEILVDQGEIEGSEEWRLIQTEIYQAIQAVVWPPGSSNFTINPTLHGNGVKPIKDGCMMTLKGKFGWHLEAPVFVRETNTPGKFDALRTTPLGDFVLEWETGNISSSHRALNKITLGITRKLLIGGVLVLPTRKLYPYLTDRIQIA
jgi:hypothetical protein